LVEIRHLAFAILFQSRVASLLIRRAAIARAPGLVSTVVNLVTPPFHGERLTTYGQAILIAKTSLAGILLLG
jgi:hypothetical protein